MTEEKSFKLYKNKNGTIRIGESGGWHTFKRTNFMNSSDDTIAFKELMNNLKEDDILIIKKGVK